MDPFDAAHESVQDAWKLVVGQWLLTSSSWRDAPSHRFQKVYMSEYEPAVSSALKGLDQLRRVISEARKTVE